MKVPISAITSVVLISYMHFLDANSISPSAMAKHISAMKAKMALCGLSLAMFDDPRMKYFQNAMFLKRPFKANLKKIIDIDTLQLIIKACDFTYMGQIFKAVYTIAFFSFLRLSNLVPHSASKFSPLHQLACGDIILAPQVSTYSLNGPRPCSQKYGKNPKNFLPGKKSHLPSSSNKEFVTYHTRLSKFPTISIQKSRCLDSID